MPSGPISLAFSLVPHEGTIVRSEAESITNEGSGTLRGGTDRTPRIGVVEISMDNSPSVSVARSSVASLSVPRLNSSGRLPCVGVELEAEEMAEGDADCDELELDTDKGDCSYSELISRTFGGLMLFFASALGVEAACRGGVLLFVPPCCWEELWLDRV